jgi:high-affinity Fe2+/Pb2+ permease
MRSRKLSVLALGAILLLHGSLAWGCPVCFSAKNDENRVAFIVTTAFLTFLPLGLIGGGVWWLRRRARQESGSTWPRRLPKPVKTPPTTRSSRGLLAGFEDSPRAR